LLLPDDRSTVTVDYRAYLYALAPLTAVALAAVLSGADPLAGDTGVVGLIGALPAAAGLAVVAWAVHTFALAGVTPAPETTPERLVTDGPLAYTRNPLYLGTVLGAGGMAILSASPLGGGYAALMAVVYHLVVVYREEPRLTETMGGEYERYCSSVPRWVGRRE
jgi:protein-S-isoprenylcysteine O-methyltransferase Ste14